jgi:hypothetical protein
VDAIGSPNRVHSGYTLGLKEGKREGFIRGKIAARKNAEITLMGFLDNYETVNQKVNAYTQHIQPIASRHRSLIGNRKKDSFLSNAGFIVITKMRSQPLSITHMAWLGLTTRK